MSEPAIRRPNQVSVPADGSGFPPGTQLKDINVLVADIDPHVLSLTRSLLNGLGMRKIRLVTDAYVVLDILEGGGADLLIADADLTPMNAVELTRHIRSEESPVNRYLPVVFTTARPSVSLILKARNAGVTEFLAKPMTMRAVEQRLRSLVERPRPFVRAPNYFGPDRRRVDDPRYKGPERRASEEDQIEI